MNHAHRRHTLKLLLLTFTGKINAIMWGIAFITLVTYDAIWVQYFNRGRIWGEVATSSSTILFWERDEVVFKIIAVLPLNLQCCYYVIWPNLGLNMYHYPALKICWTQHQNTEIKLQQLIFSAKLFQLFNLTKITCHYSWDLSSTKKYQEELKEMRPPLLST